MAPKTRKPTGIVPWPLILIEGGEKSGKAQPLHSRLMTPTGWTAMGDISVGDLVIGSDGNPTAVTHVHERGQQPIYRLTFSDGATVEACGEHLWATWTASERHRKTKKGEPRNLSARIRTTETLRELVLSGVAVHVPMAAPVEYSCEVDLPLHPYALGLLLGDGCMTKPNYPLFTPGDEPLFDALAEHLPEGDSLTRLADGWTAGIKGGNTTAIFREFGLMGCGSPDKWIPASYLFAPIGDRLALLQGLMDTDGGVERRDASFCTTSEKIATGIRHLVESLGGTAATHIKPSGYKLPDGTRRECLPAYIVTVRLPEGMSPFRLERKASAWVASRPTFHCPPRRTVRQVDYLGEQAARCITVASDDHLYLTDHFVVTHNSWACAELSASEKVGQTYWLDLNEGAADEYGAIPGARYLVIEHDGTWPAILNQVSEVREEARRASAAGEPPVVLVIDSMTAEWDLLKDWAGNRAAGSTANKQRLLKDPGAEVKVSMNLWNDATARHRRLMTMLMTFAGIVVITARGKEVASLDASGKPIEGAKEYKVEGHKNLAFDASVWVRLSRDNAPIVVGARSVHSGIRPGVDKPQPMADFTLERLVFDALKCNPVEAQVRALTTTKAGDESPEGEDLSPKAQELLALAEDGASEVDLRRVWDQILPALDGKEISAVEADRVAGRIKALGAQLTSGTEAAA